MTASKGLPRARNLGVGIWLTAVAVLVGVMILVGGATRLTESGLSITEWNLVTGVLPPLSGTAWAAEFEKYRSTTEYQSVNQGMSLEAFKTIYYWEWGHRLLGRLIGLAYLLPFAAFLAAGRILPADRWRLACFLGLIILQGVIGWWMVKSGLSGRTDVSPYRLTLHLGLAFAIFGLLMWAALDHMPSARRQVNAHPAGRRFYRLCHVLLGIVFLQIILGAFVAGTNAGFAYNTWPLIDGAFIPSGYWFLEPWYRNPFENVVAVQLNHRLGGYVLTIATIGFWVFALRLRLEARLMRMVHVFAGMVLAQVLLGIWALIEVVPIALGLAHQAGAVLVFGAAVHLAHRARSYVP